MSSFTSFIQFLITCVTAQQQLHYVYPPENQGQPNYVGTVYADPSKAPTGTAQTGYPTTADGCFYIFASRTVQCAFPFERRSTVTLQQCHDVCLSEYAGTCSGVEFNTASQRCDLYSNLFPPPGTNSGGGTGAYPRQQKQRQTFARLFLRRHKRQTSDDSKSSELPEPIFPIVTGPGRPPPPDPMFTIRGLPNDQLSAEVRSSDREIRQSGNFAGPQPPIVDRTNDNDNRNDNRNNNRNDNLFTDNEDTDQDDNYDDSYYIDSDDQISMFNAGGPLPPVVPAILQPRHSFPVFPSSVEEMLPPSNTEIRLVPQSTRGNSIQDLSGSFSGNQGPIPPPSDITLRRFSQRQSGNLPATQVFLPAPTPTAGQKSRGSPTQEPSSPFQREQRQPQFTTLPSGDDFLSKLAFTERGIEHTVTQRQQLRPPAPPILGPFSRPISDDGNLFAAAQQRQVQPRDRRQFLYAAVQQAAPYGGQTVALQPPTQPLARSTYDTGGAGTSNTNAYNSAGTSSNTYSNPGTSSNAYSNPGTSSNAYSNTGTSSNTYSNPGTSSNAYSNPGTSSNTYSNPGTSSNTYSNPGTSSNTYSNPGTSSNTYSTSGTSSNTYGTSGTSSNTYTSNTSGSGQYPFFYTQQQQTNTPNAVVYESPCDGYAMPHLAYAIGSDYYVPTGTCASSGSAGSGTAPGSCGIPGSGDCGAAPSPAPPNTTPDPFVTTTVASATVVTTTTAGLPVNLPDGAQCTTDQVVRYVQIDETELRNADTFLFDASSASDCLSACTNNQLPEGATSAPCLSVDYDSLAGMCAISADRLVPLGTGQPDFNPDVTYYEKVCVDGALASECTGPFIRQPQMILVGYAETVVEAPSLQACLDACLGALDTFGFECRSGMMFYDTNDLNCVLNFESMSTKPEFFSRTFDDAVDYFEPNCAGASQILRQKFAVLRDQRSRQPSYHKTPTSTRNVLSQREGWGPWTPCDPWAGARLRFKQCDSANPATCTRQRKRCAARMGLRSRSKDIRQRLAPTLALAGRNKNRDFGRFRTSDTEIVVGPKPPPTPAPDLFSLFGKSPTATPLPIGRRYNRHFLRPRFLTDSEFLQ